jgi:predicted RND superfamily exporter protein
VKPLIALIIRRRRAVLAVLLLLTAAFGLAIPSLEARFAPEDLVAPDEAATAAAAEMVRRFGREQDPLVLVLQTEDDARTTDLDMLAWSHRTARWLAADARIARVESPTTTPLPRAIEEGDGGPEEEVSLEALEAEPVDALGTSREEEAIGQIVGADPARFPLGLLSLADRGVRRVIVAPVVEGDSPTEAERALLLEILRDTPVVRRRLVSDDGTVSVIAAIPRSDFDPAGGAELVHAVEEHLVTDPPPAGLRVVLSGMPYLRVAMLDALRRDQLLLIALATLGSLLVLYLGTRSVPGVMLPMGTVGVTIVMTMGAMSLAHVPLDLLTNMIPPLLVTIGLAEAVHMVLRYREELARSRGDRPKAAAATLEAMWLACFVTTFTTAIGFGALILQQTDALRRFGLVAALASMLAYFVTVLFVPTMLPFFGEKALGPDTTSRSAPDLLDRAIVGIARRAARAPWRVIVVSIVLFAVSLAIGANIVSDTTLLDQFSEESEIARTTHLLERQLDGVRRLSISLHGEPRVFRTAAGLEALRTVTERVRGEEGVLRASAASDLAAQALVLVTHEEAARTEPFRSDDQVEGLLGLLASGPHDPLPSLLSEDGATARIDVRLADRGAARILAMLDEIRDDAQARGFEVAFAGEAYDASRGLDRIVRSLGSFTSAIALIFFVMMLLFRSVRLGLLSIPPNLLPLAMTLAYMVIRGIPLHAATVIVFTVTVGLLVDGATHVIARFREERERGQDVEDVLLRTMETSGRGVVLSSLTLLLGYGALLFSAFEPIRLFGELSAVAIGFALLAQLVLLPAVLAKFAR